VRVVCSRESQPSVQFNDDQLVAIQADGTVLLVAGAGSGKTRAITHKIARIIRDGVRPDRIVALTFTNKAAEEMLQRLESPTLLNHPLAKHAADSPWIGTIHSFFFSILKDDLPAVDSRYAPRVKPLDDYKAKRMIEEILKGMGFQEGDAAWDPIHILGTINSIRSGGYFRDEPRARQLFFNEDSGSLDELIYEVWGKYAESKLVPDRDGSKFVDFQDMISLTVRMFREHPVVLSKWQGCYDYILVDEFQDTDVLQAEGIWALAKEHGNMMAVGDLRQCIYAWRGADVDLTVNFPKHFEGGRVLYMNTNYRSGSVIVKHSNSLISHADFEAPDMLPNREGSQVTYLGHFDNDSIEAAQVVEVLKSIKDYLLSDFAILYRTNAQSVAFEDALIAVGIPYIIIGSVGFYGREEIKDMVAYLAMIYEISSNFQDFETRSAINSLLNTQRGFLSDYGAFERVINRPNRYLGMAFIREWATWINTGMDPVCAMGAYYSRPYMARVAAKFAELLTQVHCRYQQAGGRFADLVSDLRSTLDYDRWITRNTGETIESPKVENLNALQCRISNFPTLGAFLKYAAAAVKPEGNNGKSNAVSLMTIHSSKGREFPVVFVVGLSEGILPHYRSQDTEEERRIAYVALTRAQEMVYLSSIANRYGKGPLDPSRFIQEMGIDNG